MNQLALDVFDRTRPGRWPAEAHQRGWVRLPWRCGIGDEGDIIPAWVCCQCGGVDVGEHVLRINHGCCWNGIGCWSLDAQARFRSFGKPIEPYRPFDALWAPTRGAV